ncbi:hypothetical protein [Brevundimonas sp.]|uniref:hypothetical protein n=1 Tax=Brevundimonas sp. TaxID=1871086 RepID=UPI002D46B8EA|nr:hypothetical protein [Brevundimonas sp.]HYD29220.1 hypothetical protein [Brevundimonas sp.]
MPTTHTLATALTLRCCGPEGCGVATGSALVNGPLTYINAVGRLCIGATCMAWQWTNDADADPLEQITTSFRPDDAAFVAAVTARDDLPHNATNEVYDAAQEKVVAAREEIELALRSWEPSPPPGDGWRLRSTSCRCWDEDPPSASFSALWVRDKTPAERRGFCGYVR